LGLTLPLDIGDRIEGAVIMNTVLAIGASIEFNQSD
jgi:hypothetical protein